MTSDEAAAQQRRAARPVGEEAGDDEHERDEDEQLAERERRPRCLGRLLHARARPRRRRGPARAAQRCAARARRRRAFVSDGPCQEANGQPEESLTCHHPISMPIRPRRGRTCQTPQPCSPRSRLATRTNLWRPGSQQHPLEQRAAGLLALAALGQRSARLGQALGQRVADGLELAQRQHARAIRRACRDLRLAVRERADQRVGDLGLQRGDLAAQRARAARSSTGAKQPARGSDLQHAAESTPTAHLRSPNKRLLDVQLGHARHGDGEQPQARRAAARAAARRDVAEEHRHGVARIGHHQTAGRQVRRVLPLPQPLARARGAQAQRTVERARRRAPRPGRPVSTSAISSASSSTPREVKPPCIRRSSTAASTGVRCTSGSMPTWRKNAR